MKYNHRTNKTFRVAASPTSDVFLCHDKKFVAGTIHMSKRRSTRSWHYAGNAERAAEKMRKKGFPDACVVDGPRKELISL